MLNLSVRHVKRLISLYRTKGCLTRLRPGTPVAGYPTAQTQWRLFIPEMLEQSQGSKGHPN